MQNQNLQKIANELRMLCADMVQNANSGHPGAPLGLADLAVILSQHINIDPSDLTWLNRDRLVFSGGHASALIYALLHLWGFEVSLQDLKEFRKFGSLTPGHPEYKHTPGVEITTGPLGQGIANAVGFAMAQKRAQKLLGDLIDHKVYCFCGDGDLEEGISYEATSLAGHFKLESLVLIYDSNNISIEGDIGITFSEDVEKRFLAIGFDVIKINGHDYDEINEAFTKVKTASKPTLIIAQTTIGKGAVGLEGSHKTHGAPLGMEVIAKSKQTLELANASFNVTSNSRAFFDGVRMRGGRANAIWKKKLITDNKVSLVESLMHPDFKNISFKTYEVGKSLATRVSNGEILNAISEFDLGFIGGSADLAPSNNTQLFNTGNFPEGNNMHFGIREHAMGAISNAFANYGIYRPFCATFFVFSDYLSPSIRIASIMKAKVLYVFTHDSIGVGEDGQTHQPVEQLTHFRAMPNLITWRPCDANENVVCMQVALGLEAPNMFVLSRQNLEVLSLPSVAEVSKGAYLKSQSSTKPVLSLLASGSEVSLCLKAQKVLESEGIATQVVSMPSFDLFLESSKEYKQELFVNSKVLAVEALRGLELYAIADSVLSMESFGASGKGDVLFEHFGFSVENVVKKAKSLI
ncbi:transketolase [Helicobacter sp. 13S00401-1]|uniref:transketolase n=1 Tax=Helicobacter sp. 13S00401-1 TaxID=1905758 RepID=UPI000BA5AA5C|nr:transketolase [Helicobacter sp. 13S00401-1]PAF51678.1 transketolase [Helicobacter sp. 13S00401-1]